MSIQKSNNKMKGPDLRYLVLDPILGELAIFQSEKYFLDHKTEKSDIVRLSQVLCAMHGFNALLARKSINAIELQLQTDAL
jgi:hypothetical protein